MELRTRRGRLRWTGDSDNHRRCNVRRHHLLNLRDGDNDAVRRRTVRLRAISTGTLVGILHRISRGCRVRAGTSSHRRRYRRLCRRNHQLRIRTRRARTDLVARVLCHLHRHQHRRSRSHVQSHDGDHYHRARNAMRLLDRRDPQFQLGPRAQHRTRRRQFTLPPVRMVRYRSGVTVRNMVLSGH